MIQRLLPALGLFISLLITNACALNSADSPLGELRGGQTNDPDYFVSLWPEGPGNEPNPMLQGQLKGWPSITKDNTVLFIGDQSLQGNWGLVLQKTLVESGEDSLVLSACHATAQSWKTGSQADCLFESPFVKFKDTPVFLTQDMKSGSERALPLLLAHEKVSKVILSFGAYLKDISDAQRLQEELVAIEILAKWAHSAGKTCYFASPVGEYFLESGQVILPVELLARLKVLLEPYCYWVDSVETRQSFLEETKIEVSGKVLEEVKQEEGEPSQQGGKYIRIDEATAVDLPQLPPLILPDLELDLSDLPEIIEDKESPLAQRPKTPVGKDQPKASTAAGTGGNTSNDPQTGSGNSQGGSATGAGTTSDTTTDDKAGDDSTNVQLPDGVNQEIPLPTPRPNIEEEGKKDQSPSGEEKVSEVLAEIDPAHIPKPIPRPQFLKEQDQQAIREQIEKAPTVTEKKGVKYSEPKYLWNNNAHGASYTRIGKIELQAYGKSLYETKNLSDAKMYCPNYWNLNIDDRKLVWLYLYSALAMYESTFNTNAKAVEVTGGTSMGLFQMDYNNCKQSASRAQDLLRADVNFRCAIRKSVYLVREGKQIANGSYPSNCNQQGCKYRGGGMDRFWSTLRNPYNARIKNSKGQLVNVRVGKRQQIISHLKSLPHCKI